MQVEKYYNEKGQVGVIYSPGYGAGWSTWTSKNDDFALFDKGLVELVLRKASNEELKSYIQSKGQDIYVSDLGHQLEVEWMEPGTPFLIDEYDGFESITYSSGERWRNA